MINEKKYLYRKRGHMRKRLNRIAYCKVIKSEWIWRGTSFSGEDYKSRINFQYSVWNGEVVFFKKGSNFLHTNGETLCYPIWHMINIDNRLAAILCNKDGGMFFYHKNEYGHRGVVESNNGKTIKMFNTCPQSSFNKYLELELL